MSAIEQPLLQVKEFCKNFTGTVALDHVSCDFYPGEIHAFLGENGAGKSTLIKILSGVYEATSGSVAYAGVNLSMNVEQVPLAVIHQDLGLADDMSVVDNIALVSGYERGGGLIDWKKTKEKAADLLAMMNCPVCPNQLVGTLTAAEKSMVAISRALSLDARLLILDEPTATLPNQDVQKLFEVLTALREKGIAIIYVTHRLDEVFEIADRVTVMRNGKVVATKLIGETNPEALVFDIVGRKPSEMFIQMPEVSREKPLLEVRNLLVEGVGPVSFSLYEGEVLALFGLRGAGHHEVGRCIYGALAREKGEIYLGGENIAPSCPAHALKHQIGFVTSKRHEEGIAPSFSVRENMYINPRASARRKTTFISRNKERQRCNESIRKFTVKTTGSDAAIGVLSGGNQQKVVIARLFEADARIMILEEPTIGVDVGAKADIYHLMREGLMDGKAIILISSDYEEVSRISHRVLVFSRKKIVGEVAREEMTDGILSGMASGALCPNRAPADNYENSQEKGILS